MSRTGLASAFVLGAALVACAPTDDVASYDPVAAIAGAVPADLAADSRTAVTIAWDDAGVHPRMLTGEFAVDGATAEAAARDFLIRHGRTLAVEPAELALVTTRVGLAGTYVRFQQQVAGVAVFDHQVVVVVAADRRTVRAVNLGRTRALSVPLLTADRGPLAAIAAARARLGAIVESRAPIAIRGIEADDPAGPRLGYRVTIAATAPAATWEVAVDAATGAIRSVRDRNAYADGTGLVYDSSAVASTGNIALVDNNDATSPVLDGARFAVALRRLDGTGVLRGSWADVTPANAANRATSATLAFAYTRTDDRFEEVVAYYHLDRAQTRIQALGFTDANHRVQGARVNALAEDNSYYDPGDKLLRFGAGGVDDAEDGDIVLHEYGHSIQDDQVPGWGNGDEGAMGEGFGDYLASSFSEGLPAAAGHVQTLVQYPCVGEWDATSYDSGSPPCLRRTDGTKHAPEATDGEVHDDGEIWAAGLWRARTAVGADVMDRLVIESHFLLTTNEPFRNGAMAIVLADQMVFAGAHQVLVRRALYQHGLLRALQPAASFAAIVASQPVTIQNPHNANGLYNNRLDDTQTFTRPGSQALRVHFSSIALRANGGCDDPSCDNIYLTDAGGDLYQIFTASENGARTSVQVPGDTVKIRLVTDGSMQATGYVIDRVEAMGGITAIDAAPDAPVDARPIDARRPDAAIAPDAAPPVDAPPATVDAADPGFKGDEGGCCSTGAAPTSSGALGLLATGLLARRRRR